MLCREKLLWDFEEDNALLEVSVSHREKSSSSLRTDTGEGGTPCDLLCLLEAGVEELHALLRLAVRSIAMDPSSRAAAALTRTLLHERDGGPPEYVEVPLGEDPRRRTDTDAWLRIGDPALRETLTIDAPAWNPSEEWRRRTGLPFIFAAWIVRGDADIEPHLGAFVRARENGRAAVADLARQAASEWELPEAKCLEYLTEECSYDPGGAMAPSLAEFQRRAALAGVCPRNILPDPIDLGLSGR